MAGRKIDPSGEKQGRVKFLFFELEGNDSTLQEAIRSINAVVNRTVGNGAVGARRPAALRAASEIAQPQGDDASPSDDAVDVEPLPMDSAIDEDETTRPRPPRKKMTPPIAIPFDMTSPVPLKDYAAQYKVESDQDKYLVLAGWLKAYRNSAPLKAGLILTLYAHMDWRPQADVTMPLRRLSNKSFQWLERTATGEYQIAPLGETKLEKLKIS